MAREEGIDPAAVMAEHRSWLHEPECMSCTSGDGTRWPCEPCRLAEALAASEAKVARIEALARNLRSAEAKMRNAKGATIGRQWHEQEQAHLFGEAAELIERALRDPAADSRIAPPSEEQWKARALRAERQYGEMVVGLADVAERVSRARASLEEVRRRLTDTAWSSNADDRIELALLHIESVR